MIYKGSARKRGKARFEISVARVGISCCTETEMNFAHEECSELPFPTAYKPSVSNSTTKHVVFLPRICSLTLYGATRQALAPPGPKNSNPGARKLALPKSTNCLVLFVWASHLAEDCERSEQSSGRIIICGTSQNKQYILEPLNLL
jgi:hypothetical protein